MKLVSVNTGLPREVTWHGRSVTTGIFKQPVEGRVRLRKLNLDGDRQADLTVHGGEYKAVYCYPVAHYEYWKRELPGRELPMGMFGENFTTDGLLEDSVHLGDQFSIGSAEVIVTQPRLPCYKLGLRFESDGMVKRFLASGRTGFYLSVSREGEVGAGDEIARIAQDPNSVPVSEITRLYIAKRFGDADVSRVRRALRVAALPESWKAVLPRTAREDSNLNRSMEAIMKSLVWFITGASRGFGLEIARAALNRGDSVVAAARDPQAVERALGEHEQLLAVPLDVTNEKQARAAVDAALQRFGRIDVLVNNAGRGLLGAVEEASPEEVRSVFAVNVEGLLNVTRAVLPSMRARQSGRILNLSSVGGFTAWAGGWGVYCATKFAVEGLSEAMHAELLPLGIQVILIEPGAFRTDFLEASSLSRVKRVIDDYSGTAGATRVWAEATNQHQLGDPVKGAAAMVAIATTADPPLRLQLGTDCIARVEEKLALVAKELGAWRSVAESTDYAPTNQTDQRAA